MTFGKIMQIVMTGTKFEMPSAFWGYVKDFPQCIRVFSRYTFDPYRCVVSLFKGVVNLVLFSQVIEKSERPA